MDADKRELLDELEAAAVAWQAAKAQAATTREQLVEVVRRAREAGVSVAYIVEVAGVSRQQAHAWIKGEES